MRELSFDEMSKVLGGESIAVIQSVTTSIGTPPGGNPDFAYVEFTADVSVDADTPLFGNPFFDADIPAGGTFGSADDNKNGIPDVLEDDTVKIKINNNDSGGGDVDSGNAGDTGSGGGSF